MYIINSETNVILDIYHPNQRFEIVRENDFWNIVFVEEKEDRAGHIQKNIYKLASYSNFFLAEEAFAELAVDIGAKHILTEERLEERHKKENEAPKKTSVPRMYHL